MVRKIRPAKELHFLASLGKMVAGGLTVGQKDKKQDYWVRHP